MRCNLACSSCQLLKWSKIANSATEEWKSEGDYSTVYYNCALFYLMNAENKLHAAKWVTDILSMCDVLYDL